MHAMKLLVLSAITAVLAQEQGPTTECKGTSLDLVLALDESGSMTPEMWSDGKNFHSKMAAAVLKSFTRSRFGLTRWGTGLTTVKQINDSYNCIWNTDSGKCHADFSTACDKLVDSTTCGANTACVWDTHTCYGKSTTCTALTTETACDNSSYNRFTTLNTAMGQGGGSTYIEKAFDQCRGQFAGTKRVDSQGFAVNQFCVVTTDGAPTSLSAANTAASNLRAMGAKILMVGVANAPKANLDGWASTPTNLYSFFATNFATIERDLLKPIIGALCFYVAPFTQTCVNGGVGTRTGDVLTLTGSGFQADTGKKVQCIIRKGSIARVVDATAGNDVPFNTNCKMPTFNNDAQSEFYFPPGIYAVEASRDSGDSRTYNNNRIEVSLDCAATSSPTAKPTPAPTNLPTPAPTPAPTKSPTPPTPAPTYVADGGGGDGGGDAGLSGSTALFPSAFLSMVGALLLLMRH